MIFLSSVYWLSAALVGLMLGSFVSLVSYRLPRGEDIVWKRSCCPVCAHTLAIRDLLPLLSWCLQRGRCRYCRTLIGWRYPLIELLMLSMCLLIYLHAGWSVQLPILYGMITCMMIMAVVDIEHKILPDSVQILFGLLALAYRGINGTSWMEILQGAALGCTTGLILRYGYAWIRRREGLGLGDVKFLIVAGILLDPFSFVAFLFYSGLLGTLTGWVWTSVKKEALFPFAPALCLSLTGCLLFPEQSVFWLYQGLIQGIDYL